MQIGNYKNRTDSDAKVYLSQVFGIRSNKELHKNREILEVIEENAKEGYVMDVLVYRMYLKHLIKNGRKDEQLMAKWYPILEW